jgi:phosphomannomutase
MENVLSGKKRPITVNLSTTFLVEKVAQKFKVPVYRTKIGEVNVVNKMKQTGSIIGGEGNGGVIYPEIHYGRDSFVGMGLILEHMAETNKSISEIVAGFPQFIIKKEKVGSQGKNKNEILTAVKNFYSKEKLDTTDGIKIIRNDGWIHIRPSGTEPVIRVIAEGETDATAERYLKEGLAAVQ